MYKEYKAETQRLMGMMVNSIYTHKEIFLREIISNASDALDKLCFYSLQNHSTDFDRSKGEIKINIDKENRNLIVQDNGIGMNEEDLENNLGVIAKSGSLEYATENAGKSEDVSNIIGQFGVGFYSAFMVADKVTVLTRKYDNSQGYKWTSEGANGYEITPADVKDVGTTVIMHIRKDGKEKDEFSCYLREYPIYKLIRKYSDYIRWPIRMYMPHPEVKAGSDPKNPEYEEKFDYETVNSMIPIWKRPKSELKDEDYRQFYKEHLFDKKDPLDYLVASVEGNISYEAVLYIPAAASSTYGTDDYKPGLELFCNGVRIMEHCEALLPDYFNFIKGVVESSDINLNISREMLQQDSQLKLIKNNLEKKIKNLLDKMLKDNRSKYEELFASFGRHIKACAMDNYGENKDKLQDLILFPSFNSGKQITLEEYRGAMKKGQKYIFYVSARNIKEAEIMPQVESFRDTGYDFLLFTDKVDEIMVQMFGNYHDIEFKSVLNGVYETDKKSNASDKEKESLDYIKEVLKGKVDEVRFSSRMKNHPVILTSGDGITFEMEKYFRSLTPDMPMHSKKILELNPEHEAFSKLKEAINTDKAKAEKYIEILYQQGRLMAGLGIENPTEYTDLLCSLWK